MENLGLGEWGRNIAAVESLHLLGVVNVDGK